MAEMKKIKQVAQKRRARLLREYLDSGDTITKLAVKKGVTRARMSQLINMALKEQASQATAIKPGADSRR